MSQQTFLLCPPRFFEVSYQINPWMQPKEWHDHETTHAEEAHAQWDVLVATIKACGANVTLMEHIKGWPDMVFTANAGIVLDRKALVANFKHPERSGETAYYRAAFEKLVKDGLLDEVHMLPEGIHQEGAGDCLWDASRGFFWGAIGPRSDAAAYDEVERVFGHKVERLTLATDEFYHLDVCLSPLPSGHVLCHPPAFAPESFARIKALVGDKLIEVGKDDASAFCINCVHVGAKHIIMSPCSSALRSRLESLGYQVRQHDFSAFILAGGSACCLTINLNRTAKAHATATA